MAHKFDPKHIYKLDNPERRKALPPAEILTMLGLKNNDVMLDIGAGIGYFSLPASEIVGRGGAVYAIDTSEDMISELGKRIAEAGAFNIKAVKSTEYGFGIGPDTADFAFMCNVLHEIDDRKRFLDETIRVMKKGGRLAVIEWIKKAMEHGPPENERISIEELSVLLIKSGFGNIEIKAYNEDYYYAVCTKP